MQGLKSTVEGVDQSKQLPSLQRLPGPGYHSSAVALFLVDSLAIDPLEESKSYRLDRA
jgi:hypothetical protein